MLKILFKNLPETLAIIFAGIIYFFIAGLGLYGLYFTISKYHTTWKEICIIIISINLISTLGYYFKLSNFLQTWFHFILKVIFRFLKIDNILKIVIK